MKYRIIFFPFNSSTNNVYDNEKREEKPLLILINTFGESNGGAECSEWIFFFNRRDIFFQLYWNLNEEKTNSDCMIGEGYAHLYKVPIEWKSKSKKKKKKSPGHVLIMLYELRAQISFSHKQMSQEGGEVKNMESLSLLLLAIISCNCVWRLMRIFSVMYTKYSLTRKRRKNENIKSSLTRMLLH